MDDDNSKEDQPSTSKKENPRLCPGSEADDKNEGQDSRIGSDTSVTSSISIHTRMGMTSARHKMPKPATGMKPEPKPVERKKKRKPPGRVEKRLLPRRQPVRKVPKRRIRNRHGRRRRGSSSTIFTRLSSDNISPSVGCIYCGHRCCRRRSEDQLRKLRKVRRIRRSLRGRRRKCQTTQTQGKLRVSAVKRVNCESECVQVGSRSLMLSSLCIDTTVTPDQMDEEPTEQWSEITPEMIYAAVQKLTMWKQEVTSLAILNYLRSNFPVNHAIPALFHELLEKLQVAAIAGIVMQRPSDRWRLCCALENRRLTKTHVTKFWTIYTDTMRPVTRKLFQPPPSQNEENNKKVPPRVTHLRNDNDEII